MPTRDGDDRDSRAVQEMRKIDAALSSQEGSVEEIFAVNSAREGLNNHVSARHSREGGNRFSTDACPVTAFQRTNVRPSSAFAFSDMESLDP